MIKDRIKELHSLGISHNHIRIPNIHVSESGKVSLIDFGLSDASNNESCKVRDLQLLDKIFMVGRYSPKEGNYGEKRNHNKGKDKNYPSLLHQNKNRNIESSANEPMLLHQNTDRNKENFGNDAVSYQNQEHLEKGEEDYDIQPLSFHDIDPFFGRGPY